MDTRFSSVILILLAFAAVLHAAPAAPVELSTRLKAFCDDPVPSIGGRTLLFPRAVAKFYRARGGRPIWVASGGTSLGSEAVALVEAIGGIRQDGLSPDDYHFALLTDAVLAETPEDLFGDEILLTDAFLALGDHLSSGKLEPSSLDNDWAIRPQRSEMTRVLEGAAKSGGAAAALKRLAPTDARYRKLKAALAAYRAIAEAGPFLPVADGAPLVRGSHDPRVAELRLRLAQEGYLKAGEAPSLYFDESLEKVLSKFQADRGLEPTGVLSASTSAALATPVAQLIRQIDANLERLRWLPRKLGGRYLFVDIAGFQLIVFEGNRPALTMRIIVGEEYRRTPMLSTKITSIVLNPYWTIPKSILAEDIIPRARVNPSYLVKRDIRVYEDTGGARRQVNPASIDWSKVRADGAPYLFQEHSGPKNPLGNVKFFLRNSRSVYLHGTPAVHLFEKEQRTLSHGCIRVESPIELASYLLRGSPTPWSKAALKNSIAEGLEVSLPLSAAIPVQIWYRTAWVDGTGRLQFRRDVYGWDESLGDALEGKQPVVPKDLRDVLRGKTASLGGELGFPEPDAVALASTRPRRRGRSRRPR